MRSPRASPAAAAGDLGRTAATVTPLGSAIESVFRRVLPLHDGRGVEEAHALDDVLKPRDDRETGREPEHRPWGELDLEERRRLPRPRRMRMDAPAEHVDEERSDHQDDVAADDDGGDPER